MKKLFLLLTTCSLLLSTNLCNAQTWYWAYPDKNNDTNSACESYGIAADLSGNTYETGQYFGSVTFGTHTLVSSPDADAYVVKRDNKGNVLWAKSSLCGSNGYCFGYSITVDHTGNVYLTGECEDSVGFSPYALNGVALSFFLVKYNSAGNVLWVRQGKGTNMYNESYGTSVYCDASGNILVSGTFNDTLTIGSYKLKSVGLTNSFLVKYDSNGNVLWAICPKQSVYGGQACGGDVVADNSDNIYWSGVYMDSTQIGSDSLPYSFVFNAYLVKLSPGGITSWAKTPKLLDSNYSAIEYNTTINNIVLTIDGGGNVYMAGGYYDSVGFGTHIIYAGKSVCVFLAKYNQAGNVLWAKTSVNPPSSPFFEPYGLSASLNNNSIYMCGSFQDSISFDGKVLVSGGTLPSFIVKYDTSGNVLCGTYVNNYNDDNNDIVADPLGDNAFFNGDIFGDTCSFGPYVLNGVNEYGFIGKWTCSPTGQGVNEIPNSNTVTLYPNPNNGAFMLQVNSEQLKVNSVVEIYNALGQKVYNGRLTMHNGQCKIDLSIQSNGVYLYRIITASGKQIADGKFVIEK